MGVADRRVRLIVGVADGESTNCGRVESRRESLLIVGVGDGRVD